MKLKNRRVSVGISKTINVGNYESVKVHTGLSADIDNKAYVNEAYMQLFEECTHQIEWYVQNRMARIT